MTAGPQFQRGQVLPDGLAEGTDVQVEPGTVKCQGMAASLLAWGGDGRRGPRPSSEPHVAVGCGRQIRPLPRTLGKYTNCSTK